MQRHDRGFTLIELGVVIAVLSILAGVVLPDFIELARNEHAKQAAIHVADLQDQAKTFFHQTVQEDLDPWEARWPGEAHPNTCAGSNPLQALVTAGIINPDAKNNPWEVPIKMELIKGTGTDELINQAVCRLRIVTEVPERVAGVVETYLPGGVCGDECGEAQKDGFLACCSSVPKPGLEAALQRAVISAKAEE